MWRRAVPRQARLLAPPQRVPGPVAIDALALPAVRRAEEGLVIPEVVIWRHRRSRRGRRRRRSRERGRRSHRRDGLMNRRGFRRGLLAGCLFGSRFFHRHLFGDGLLCGRLFCLLFRSRLLSGDGSVGSLFLGCRLFAASFAFGHCLTLGLLLCCHSSSSLKLLGDRAQGGRAAGEAAR